MLENLNSHIFSEHLKTTFQVRVRESGLMPLELFEVTEKDHSTKLEQFSLVFRGPRTSHLPQGTYTLEHEKLGNLDLFLVPLGPDPAGMRYQAIFCRVR